MNIENLLKNKKCQISKNWSKNYIESPITSVAVFADCQFADSNSRYADILVPNPTNKKQIEITYVLRDYLGSLNCLGEFLDFVQKYGNLGDSIDGKNETGAESADLEIYSNWADLKSIIVQSTKNYSGARVQAEKSVKLPKIESIINLGDFIDGRLRDKNDPETVLKTAVKSISEKVDNNPQLLHCVGNHELYCLNFEQISRIYYPLCNSPSNDKTRKIIQKLPDTFAYVTELKGNPAIKIIHLDNFDLSKLRPRTHSNFSLANQFLAEKEDQFHGSNFNLFMENSESDQVNSETNNNRRFSDSILDYNHLVKNFYENNRRITAFDQKSGNFTEVKPFSRYVHWTGGLSNTQLQWFESTLSKLNQDPTTSIILLISHVPIHPNAVCQIQKDKLSWNFEKIHEIIDRCNSKNKILAYLAGHHHGGGYFYDSKRKIHHVTVKSMLENTETNAFGVLEFYREYAVLRGFGAVVSRLMRYNEGMVLDQDKGK